MIAKNEEDLDELRAQITELSGFDASGPVFAFMGL